MNSLRYSVGFALVGTMFMSVPKEAAADSTSLETKVRERAAAIESKLIGWRRDIHQHPELGDQENRTSHLVSVHQHSLGLEVRTGVAHTGVVGVLKGAKPGRTVALRADMDALPVKEPDGLPFASKAKGRHWGKEVDVMHACGHDAHTAMLMATGTRVACPTRWAGKQPTCIWAVARRSTPYDVRRLTMCDFAMNGSTEY